MTAEFVIGVDLGTTNSVVAYTPLGVDEPDIRLLDIPQLVAQATIETRSSLPSFLYAGTEAESTGGGLDVPWDSNRAYAVGEFARQQGAEIPDRTVGAAKSWLCHHRVDRHAAILPWNAPETVAKLSPVTATKRYIEHLVAAWHVANPDSPIDQQHVVLTVPASFDASARDLTREAAIAAGLPESLVLLEEPQAAVYAWLADTGDQWRRIFGVGDRLLVCDIGGGTTDLTLIEAAEDDGELFLERKAVGNHLLVGGDNMDLAIAWHVSQQFKEKGVELDPWQSVSLWHSCREAKEALLATDGPETHSISVLGRGSRLIGGTVSVDVDRKAVADLLVNGFFPQCKPGEKPEKAVQSGFQDIGLPYEADTGITRHLVSFLTQYAKQDEPVLPNRVLFNGGVFKSTALRDVLLDRLGSWFKKKKPQSLEGEPDLDHAVARGAAHYGWSKKHRGIRIRGGTARSYYIGIETAGLAIPGAPRPLRALCVVPHGMEEGTEVDVESSNIGLVVGQPARFRFFGSTARQDDQPGQSLDRWSPDELIETDPLEATLDAETDSDQSYVPVRFQSKITELGQFELWCVDQASDNRWKLEFNVREDDPA